MLRWKEKFVSSQTSLSVKSSNPIPKPSTLSECLGVCDRDLYPNIYVIFQLLLSLPVGSCCCERSFSALRRLKTYLRTTTSEARLNGLALANIHKYIDVDLDKVIQRWDGSGHRRIHLAFKAATDADELR